MALPFPSNLLNIVVAGADGSSTILPLIGRRRRVTSTATLSMGVVPAEISERGFGRPGLNVVSG